MKIFVVDDERIIRVSLVDDLRDAGYKVREFSNARIALMTMQEDMPDVVISDMKMPEMDGLEFLKKAKELNPDVYFIMMTAFSTVSTAVEAMKHGAYDYINKPFNNEKLLIILRRIKELIKVKDENKYLRKQIEQEFDLSSFVGKSGPMTEVFDLIKIVADKTTSVLITGETGTGKELLTKVIHYNSNRRKNPLIKVSCAILNREIFESELFGHVKGAFTGADSDKKGRFELADTGTIYLDDIDDVPLELQVKLLRALEEREIERLGGKEPIKIDFRVIASTKKDLKRLVEEGKFREDLFYRLNVFPINIPPLRERVSDIPALVDHFASLFSEKEPIMISPEVYETLKAYPFPGNARELKNLTERLVLLARDNRITGKTIPNEIKFPGRTLICSSPENKTLTEILEEVERNTIFMALDQSLGNKAKAAEMLGIPASTLKSKLAKY
ncbi:MAG: sigma-54-dependent Fis family transcriptional regulator [Chlorobi bacterium]|nr:sigma-54-dependent Fis family transcriptional regulator [Chlorobiota bacterium]